MAMASWACKVTLIFVGNLLTLHCGLWFAHGETRNVRYHRRPPDDKAWKEEE